TDPLWADYRDLALQHGLRACWSEPIFDSKRNVLGSFAMYHRQVSEPTGEDLRNIRVAAHVAGIAIERERTEEARQTAERERERIERHIAECSLAEAGEQRFRALTETAKDGIISADGEGMIVGWNSAARTMFGYGDDEVLGKPLTILMSEHYRAAHLQGLARFQSSGEGRLIGHTIEVQGQRKDGAEFPIELSLSTWATGGKRFFAGIIRDITERRRTEEELKRAMAELARSNADLDQFAHVASHDLQEPLRTVAGFVQLLERNGRGKLDADASEWIRLALEGTKRMQQLIQDLLAYARVSTRGRHFEQTDSGAALEHALANLVVAISESGASVTHDPMPVLNADPAQLTQLFQNLIGNGVKFRTATRPEIHVGAQQKNGDWVFSVRDNGIGIEPKDRDRVFVIFQRLHSRDEYPGTGIGLAICKRIVERHGGRIWVESEPGKVSTFFFTIPRKVAPPRESGAPSPKTDGAS
ncbi:MAG: PAS domain S-box protein, partial [Chthoniobacteraceae bacterium]